MKNIVTILLALITCYSSYAQNPQLFENTWYLQKVVIDSQNYFPPSNNEVDNVTLDINEMTLDTYVCETLLGSITNINNDQIEILEFIILIDTCLLPDTISFQNLYFENFFKWQLLNNVYDYIIGDGTNDSKILTLTNSDGNQAIYGNEILSTQDFNNLSFSLYPNPVQNALYIENKNNIEITTLKIYDVLGRLVLEEKRDINQLDVSSLENGLFFVIIETDKGSITKKIIKQ